MSQPIAIDEVKTYLTDLQDRLCRKLADVDGDTARFHEDLWTQENGGGGRTRVLRDGHVFEQAQRGIYPAPGTCWNPIPGDGGITGGAPTKPFRSDLAHERAFFLHRNLWQTDLVVWRGL
jgi:hypothetical protein